MQTHPLVTAVITNYNYGQYLHASIGSVLAQTHAPLEVILVDDGSTDDSMERLQPFAAELRLIRQPNAGQAAALDAGVAAASGEIICFLDADDAWLPSKVARVVEAFAQAPDALWLRHTLTVTDQELRTGSARVPRIRGTRLHRLEPRAVTERVVNATMSGFALRRGLAARVFPLERGAAVRRAVDFRLDADALLLARCSRERPRGWSLDAALGLYRRHGEQAFADPSSVARLLERQLQVGLVMAEEAGCPEPSSNHKHRAVLAALAGGRRRHFLRGAAFIRGVGAALPLVRTPPLLLRQLAALTYATVAPRRWLRRLQTEQELPAG